MPRTKDMVCEELEDIKNSNYWDIINPSLTNKIANKFNLAKEDVETAIEEWLELYKLI